MEADRPRSGSGKAVAGRPSTTDASCVATRKGNRDDWETTVMALPFLLSMYESLTRVLGRLRSRCHPGPPSTVLGIGTFTLERLTDEIRLL